MTKQKTISETIDLSERTAIVTGGAMGIGYAICYRLAEAGASVVIADNNNEAAKKASDTLNESGYKTIAIETDVSKDADVSGMIEKAIGEFGRVDILVNNAGIFPAVPVVDMEESEFEKIIDINLKGVFHCTKHVSNQMIKQGDGGKIINITSIDAIHPSIVGLSAYDASKHGVWGFTKNTALELAEHNITVNAIAPGAIATPGVGAGGEQDDQFKEQVDTMVKQIPMLRMGDPDEIGKVALFLASDLSSYMTGSQIVADGGVLLS